MSDYGLELSGCFRSLISLVEVSQPAKVTRKGVRRFIRCGAAQEVNNSRRAVYGYDQRAEVFGSLGMVAIGNEVPSQHVRFDGDGGHSSPLRNFFMDRYTESYLNEMRAFIAAVRGQAAVPVNGHDGQMAVAIGLAAAISVRENRTVKIANV